MLLKFESRVKYTLPGPMTIMDCTMDSFYGNDKKKDLIDDLIGVINKVFYRQKNTINCVY